MQRVLDSKRSLLSVDIIFLAFYYDPINLKSVGAYVLARGLIMLCPLSTVSSEYSI